MVRFWIYFGEPRAFLDSLDVRHDRKRVKNSHSGDSGEMGLSFPELGRPEGGRPDGSWRHQATPTSCHSQLWGLSCRSRVPGETQASSFPGIFRSTWGSTISSKGRVSRSRALLSGLCLTPATTLPHMTKTSCYCAWHARPDSLCTSSPCRWRETARPTTPAATS